MSEEVVLRWPCRTCDPEKGDELVVVYECPCCGKRTSAIPDGYMLYKPEVRIGATVDTVGGVTALRHGDAMSVILRPPPSTTDDLTIRNTHDGATVVTVGDSDTRSVTYQYGTEDHRD